MMFQEKLYSKIYKVVKPIIFEARENGISIEEVLYVALKASEDALDEINEKLYQKRCAERCKELMQDDINNKAEG